MMCFTEQEKKHLLERIERIEREGHKTAPQTLAIIEKMKEEIMIKLQKNISAIREDSKKLQNKLDEIFPVVQKEITNREHWRWFWKNAKQGGIAAILIAAVLAAVFALSGYTKAVILYWLGK